MMGGMNDMQEDGKRFQWLIENVFEVNAEPSDSTRKIYHLPYLVATDTIGGKISLRESIDRAMEDR